MTGITSLTLEQTASAIAKGELSSVQATRACLEAFEAHGAKLNAVVALDAEAALEAARLCDEAQAKGGHLGPLHGVPMAHKDMFYRKGRISACGTTLRAQFRPTVTATVLEKLDAAGAVDLGRLNMVEFALGLTGHNGHTGHPRNPWHTEHITGGSSSGPAASVAARLTYASLGSDTGGSIRVPAACTQLVGIKPTYGRVSRANAMPLSQSLDHVGPLTRTAGDAALLLNVIAGQDPSDPSTSQRTVPDYRAALKEDLKGVRIGVARPPFEVPISSEMASLMDDSERRLKELGAQITDITLPPMEILNTMRRVLMLSETAARHRDFVETSLDSYNPQTMARMHAGFLISAADYIRAASWRAAALRDFVSHVFARIDILHLPAMPDAVPRIDDTDSGDERFVQVVNNMGYFICPFNYLGLPAITIPAGFTANGLPAAMQLVARPFAESRLLRAAHAFDAASQFSARVPPIHS